MRNYMPRGSSKKSIREVKDARKPVYFVFIVDTSFSMKGNKIEELALGLENSLESLRQFEKNNVLYKVYYQIVELNSYGKALFPDFVPISMASEKFCFEASGVTCLENSLNTALLFLDPKHMPNCNRAVNLILMSDGYPTDVEGNVLDESVYQETIREFKRYLQMSRLRSNVDMSAIGIGEDACRDMLFEFADEGKFYMVEDCESLAQTIDFVTRKPLERLTTREVRIAEDVQEDLPSDSQDDSQNDAQSASLDSPLDARIVPRAIDVMKCLGDSCLACVDTCVLSAIENRNGFVTIQPALCIGCGSCEKECPADAIEAADESGCDELL